MRIFFFWNSSYANHRWTAIAAPGLGGCKLSANSEIAWHYGEALRQAFGHENVISVNMGDRIDHGNRSVNGHAIADGDVCIGHIGPWAEDCHELGIKYIVMVSWPSQMRWPYDRFVYHPQHQRVLDRAATVIALCGVEGRPFAPWQSPWVESAKDHLLNRWRDKVIPMRLGFDRALFPQVKHSFNPPGQRGFLFVGQVSEQKGAGPMLAAFVKLKYPLYIGNGEWEKGPQLNAEHIVVLDWVDNADYPFWAALAPKVDVFLSLSQWDCQPVAPLENLSRGFAVLSTPCSCIGPYSSAFEIAQSGIPTSRAIVQGLVPNNLEALELVVQTWQEAPTEYLVEQRDRQLAWLDTLTWAAPLEQLVQIVRKTLEA